MWRVFLTSSLTMGRKIALLPEMFQAVFINNYREKILCGLHQNIQICVSVLKLQCTSATVNLDN